VHLSAQGTDLLFDLPLIFSGWPFFLGWSDQSLGQQGHNGLEHLLPTGLCPQYSARLFHFAPFLSIAVPTAREEVAFNLLPGWPRPISGKKVKLRPQVQNDLINGDAAGIEEAQRLGLHPIW
jgi:hypothetical protein